MKHWPRPWWAHALISFAFASVLALLVFIRTNNTHFIRYAKEYPHDGQDGLGALMDAFEAGSVTLIGVFVASFVLQRIVTEPPAS
jgi:hypothetical protein